MSDAQNLFDDGLAHQGVSWRCAECVAHLVGSRQARSARTPRGEVADTPRGFSPNPLTRPPPTPRPPPPATQLPPFIVVGIDAAGAFRSLNYLPWPPGSGAGGFRPDCARWPGGGVEGYLRRVISDVAPLAQARFGASALRERCVFGGASFAGVAALHAALAHPDVFGGALVESPSLWAAEGAYLGTMRAHGGPVAERVWLGSGTREFSATREHEENGVRPHVDWLLQDYHAQAASVLADKGCTDGRLRYQLDEGAGHHEGAWAWRLHAALLHLFHGRM